MKEIKVKVFIHPYLPTTVHVEIDFFGLGEAVRTRVHLAEKFRSLPMTFALPSRNQI